MHSTSNEKSTSTRKIRDSLRPSLKPPNHLFLLQLMEFMYGVATSTEVAYFTYIYARVDASLYQRVTGYVRAALLLGRFASGVLSQSLVSSGALTFYQLNYISFCSVTVAFCIAVCLPSVQHSMYFHRQVARDPASLPDVIVDGAQGPPVDGKGEPRADVADKRRIEAPSATDPGMGRSTEALAEPERRSCCEWLRDAGRLMLADFKAAYSSPTVVQWSVWWAFATCGNLQVGNYAQPLWEEIAPWEDYDSEAGLYNGLVEASNTLLGTCTGPPGDRCGGGGKTVLLHLGGTRVPNVRLNSSQRQLPFIYATSFENKITGEKSFRNSG